MVMAESLNLNCFFCAVDLLGTNIDFSRFVPVEKLSYTLERQLDGQNTICGPTVNATMHFGLRYSEYARTGDFVSMMNDSGIHSFGFIFTSDTKLKEDVFYGKALAVYGYVAGASEHPVSDIDSFSLVDIVIQVSEIKYCTLMLNSANMDTYFQKAEVVAEHLVLNN